MLRFNDSSSTATLASSHFEQENSAEVVFNLAMMASRLLASMAANNSFDQSL
jgi:hypothetical protein